MPGMIWTPAFVWKYLTPVVKGHLNSKYSESLEYPHSSSCSDLTVSLIVTRIGLWTGQISAFQSTFSWINNFSSLYLLFCRQALEEADSEPGSPGWREAMSIPDGAMEALPGEALLQLEIQQLVGVQVRGQSTTILLCVKTPHSFRPLKLNYIIETFFPFFSQHQYLLIAHCFNTLFVLLICCFLVVYLFIV